MLSKAHPQISIALLLCAITHIFLQIGQVVLSSILSSPVCQHLYHLASKAMQFLLPKAPANTTESLYFFPLPESSPTYLIEFTEAYLTQFSPGNLLQGSSHPSQTTGSSIHFNSSAISRILFHSSPPFFPPVPLCLSKPTRGS